MGLKRALIYIIWTIMEYYIDNHIGDYSTRSTKFPSWSKTYGVRADWITSCRDMNPWNNNIIHSSKEKWAKHVQSELKKFRGN
ncbi:hypothetical protein AGMMS50239_38930 [Bacteroidia bacterium]|nr:hypothetical protein AGMMS50239_38930 [Bacteroidia bacterium]